MRNWAVWGGKLRLCDNSLAKWRGFPNNACVSVNLLYYSFAFITFCKHCPVKYRLGFFTRRKSLVCFHYSWFITLFSVHTVGRLCFPGHLSDRVMGGGGGGGWGWGQTFTSHFSKFCPICSMFHVTWTTFKFSWNWERFQHMSCHYG